MGRIYENVTEMIGKTPLMRVRNFAKAYGVSDSILAKLEYFNPAGSIKDRAALYMIEDAERKGVLREGSVIIEPTSGNTGIGLASIASSKGYKVILTMPDTMSIERIKLLQAYGAQIILTEGALGMKGAIAKAEEIAANTQDSFIAGQFINDANPESHRQTTGPEIWEDTDGHVDILVAGVGTGGTITGIGEYLKSKNKEIQIVAVEPDTSPLLSKGISGPHKLQGIGANFVPDILNRDVIDEVITIGADEAYHASRQLGRTEGILVGITSGAALAAAVKLASRPENEGKNIVVILPDTGDRYLSTELFG